MFFAIRNGQLVPTNPEFKDFYDVHNALGHVDAGEPLLGDIAVVVADARQPLRRVPKDSLTLTTVNDDPNQDVYLFWAVNEDDGNKEVIVAFDNLYTSDDPNDLWRIIGFDEWTQLPLNKELICAFSSVDEARSCIHDGMVFVPVEMDGGWRRVNIHGYNRPWDIDDIRNAEHPLLIEMGLIPTGWQVRNVILWKDLPNLEDVLTEDEVSKLHGAYKTAALVRVVGTETGGAVPIFRLEDGESGGIVLIYKIFTHEDAKTSLRL